MDDGQETRAKPQGGSPRLAPPPDREELFARAVCITGVTIIWTILALIFIGYVLGYGRI